MTRTIWIQDRDRPLNVTHGANLMEVLVSNGVMLRVDCGGQGRCGKCQVRVRTAGQKVAATVLACRTPVTDDCLLEIPENSRFVPEIVTKGPLLLTGEGLPAKQTACAPVFGMAVDIGTTTLAVYVCDMGNKKVLGTLYLRNPQAVFGEDVISRISACQSLENGVARLQALVVRSVDWAMVHLCRGLCIDASKIDCAVVVGNPTMLHLLLGQDPSPIGTYPFCLPFKNARRVRGDSLGLTFNPNLRLRTLPLISGYVGADVVGAALAAELSRRPPGTLLVDVGTNGELLMVTEKGIVATACAIGPAFEGASIQHGMQASSGAIDEVHFLPGLQSFVCHLIQHDPDHPRLASGLCGSGVISAVAELLRAGWLKRSGRFDTGQACQMLRRNEHGHWEVELVSGEVAQEGQPIVLSQADVRAVQLAKSALRTGIELLCRHSGIEKPERILIAGTFGSVLPFADACDIGLFPELPEDAIEVIGNAAGAGALLALWNEDLFNEGFRLAESTQVFDLAADPDFQKTFIRYLSF